MEWVMMIGGKGVLGFTGEAAAMVCKKLAVAVAVKYGATAVCVMTYAI